MTASTDKISKANKESDPNLKGTWVIAKKKEEVPQRVGPNVGGFLSRMQDEVVKAKPARFHDLLATGGVQEEEAQVQDDDLEQLIYNNARNSRKVYAEDKLHVSFLEFIIIMLLGVDGFTLEPLYTNQYPMRILKINVPFIIRLHLNHPTNATILGLLAEKTQKLNPSAFRMLKLFSSRFFQPSLLTDLIQFAEGAYGRVYGCKLLGENVAVKQMDVPRSIQDRCVPHDIFTEITILDKWKADERICKMIDFGVDQNHFWIVMKRYATSLKDWRQHQIKPLEENLLLYLNIYWDILNNSTFLEENYVNHYDIKCDNFLIEPFDTELKKEDLYNQELSTPNFTVCLADFGESLIYSKESSGCTEDNRGTEWIKSPEMLVVAYARNVERESYDRRKQVGAGPSSDIWSLGCLFFELLTGEFLFYDNDWVRFYIRLTQKPETSDEDLITPERQAMLDNNRDLIGFLSFILIRIPFYRPKINDVIHRFKILYQKLNTLYQQKKKLEKERKKEKDKRTEGEGGGGEGEMVNRPRSRPLQRTNSSPAQQRITTTDDIVETSVQSNDVSSTTSFRRISSNTPSSARNQPNRKLVQTGGDSISQSPPLPSTPPPPPPPPPPPSLEQSSATSGPRSKGKQNPVLQKKVSVQKILRSLVTTKDQVVNEKSLKESINLSKVPEDNNKEKLKVNFDEMRQREAEERRSALDRLDYCPRKFHSSEEQYFDQKPSLITNYLFLGSYGCLKNKILLKDMCITHIVNCTENENEHPEHFTYFEETIPKGAEEEKSTLIQKVFPLFFDFVRNNAKQRARILVVSTDGVGACLIIGFLMENRRMTFFEAFQFVLQKRYVIHLDKWYIQQLIGWEKDQKKSGFKEYFGCLCKANTWTLLSPFEKTEHQNPRPCNCQFADNSECPNHGCGNFCEQITSKWRTTSIQWGYTFKDNVQMNITCCEEHTPLLYLPAEQRLSIEDKPWKVYRCRKCEMLCYAENIKNPNEVAIVTNLSAEPDRPMYNKM